jgi:hypothetical protein
MKTQELCLSDMNYFKSSDQKKYFFTGNKGKQIKFNFFVKKPKCHKLILIIFEQFSVFMSMQKLEIKCIQCYKLKTKNEHFLV